MHARLTRTRIPCERTFACVIILSRAAHESVGMMTALILHCSIMKMIRHMAVFALIVYSAVPMRATDVMCAELLQFWYSSTRQSGKKCTSVWFFKSVLGV